MDHDSRWTFCIQDQHLVPISYLPADNGGDADSGGDDGGQEVSKGVFFSSSAPTQNHDCYYRLAMVVGSQSFVRIVSVASISVSISIMGWGNMDSRAHFLLLYYVHCFTPYCVGRSYLKRRGLGEDKGQDRTAQKRAKERARGETREESRRRGENQWELPRMHDGAVPLF